jgi:Uma2 family endonuclease
MQIYLCGCRFIVMQMQELAKPKMTVDEFLAWAEENPGRYELSEGDVYAMPPRALNHAKTKFAVQSALLSAIRKARLPCHMVPDGATLRVSKWTAYEPDALVYCGPQKPGSAIEVPDPVIVVEVLSPGTRHIDNAAKLSGYFALPSVCHYLIVDREASHPSSRAGRRRSSGDEDRPGRRDCARSAGHRARFRILFSDRLNGLRLLPSRRGAFLPVRTVRRTQAQADPVEWTRCRPPRGVKP